MIRIYWFYIGSAERSTTLSGTWRLAYSFDALSRPTSVTSTAEGTSSYTYDITSQVTAATHTGQPNETYGFDANSNRNTAGYTVATNNQSTAGLGFTFTFDSAGNRLTRTETSTGKVQSYEWDYRNRLTAVIDRNTSAGPIVKQVNYEYDPYNRLVKRSLDPDGAGPNPATTQYWAYDQGINALLQIDGSSASNLSHRYLWSEQVDQLLADEQITSPSVPGNTLWGLADNLGSLRDIADFNESTGVTSIANHRVFSSTGKLVSETNSAIDLLFAFTGKQLDDSTDLQHNLYRWYDAAFGQWLSEDPLGFEAGDENLRRYVSGNAVGSIDPTGLVVNPQLPTNQEPREPGELLFDDVLKLLRRPLEHKITDTIKDSVRDTLFPRAPRISGPYFPSDLPTVPADFTFQEQEYYFDLPILPPLLPEPGQGIPIPVMIEGPYGPFSPGTKIAVSKILFSTMGTQTKVEFQLPSDIDYRDAFSGDFRSIFDQIQDKTKGRIIDGITFTFEFVK